VRIALGAAALAGGVTLAVAGPLVRVQGHTSIPARQAYLAMVHSDGVLVSADPTDQDAVSLAGHSVCNALRTGATPLQTNAALTSGGVAVDLATRIVDAARDTLCPGR
jgi:hypothetical protein